MYLSPAQTTKSYEASDGVNTTMGSLQLQNVLIVTGAKGEAGAMRGMAVNNGQSAIKVAVTTGKKTTTITVPAETAVRLDGKRTPDSKATVSPVSVPSVAVQPGDSQKVTFSTSKSGANDVQVPVLLDQYPYGSASPEHPTFTPPPNTETEEPPA
jgi:hypothetical protein